MSGEQQDNQPNKNKFNNPNPNPDKRDNEKDDAEEQERQNKHGDLKIKGKEFIRPEKQNSEEQQRSR